MPKDPAFLFYPGNWLGGTMLMSRPQKGAYVDLLMAQFNGGRLSESDVQTILGQDYGLWEGKLKSKFFVDKDGFYYNERLELEIEKRMAYCESRRASRMCGRTSRRMSKHTSRRASNSNKDINKDKEGRGGMGGKPSLEEARNYFKELGLYSDEADHFFDHFESNGWRVSGKTPMRDWKASARNWKRNDKKFANKKSLRTLKDTQDFAREVMKELNS